MCSFINDIPREKPSLPYVLLNRSILSNCDKEAENNFLLESLAACNTSNLDLVMYFTVTLAFVNYFDNLVECLNIPILKNWKTQPILLESFEINSSLLQVPKMLKDFVHQDKNKKEIFDLQERHVNNNDLASSKNSFFNNYIIRHFFLFVMALISLLIATVVVSVVCKHTKFKALVTSIPLQHIKWTEAIDHDKFKDIYCTCQMQWYTIAMMLLTLLGMIYIFTIKLRKSTLPRGHLFSNVVKVMLFVLDAQCYVPVKLCKVARINVPTQVNPWQNNPTSKKNDTFCNNIITHMHCKSHAKYFTDAMDILHKKVIDFNSTFSSVVTPKILTKYLLHASHDSLGHVGATKLNYFTKKPLLLPRHAKNNTQMLEPAKISNHGCKKAKLYTPTPRNCSNTTWSLIY